MKRERGVEETSDFNISSHCVCHHHSASFNLLESLLPVVQMATCFLCISILQTHYFTVLLFCAAVLFFNSFS